MVKISEAFKNGGRTHRTEGERLADVGTDHGYVPIYLVDESASRSAIAMDIRNGTAGACQGTHPDVRHGRLHTDPSVGRRCGAKAG
ncbi:tRNA (adenine(22)-N(1))-methyltransferase TrmK [Roseburia hominis]|uniref:tRNA (adenine(22)-N(1))-methyltransferase TrmK n=1 Tax=Roseburia hominis TaxID=301301 RepID=UPI0024320803|nr:tRNA (adenine(22)-N(1))-methyltransferase TrmK [Roseburia hominis]